MSTAISKVLLGKEDCSRHDPATDGTSPTTFARPTSTGGTTPITKLSANDLALLDAVALSGLNTPYEVLPDTLSGKSIEAALAWLRKNGYSIKSFEGNGGIPGSGITQAQADNNRLLLDQIMGEISSTGQRGGIFFGCDNWLFDGVGAGSPILAYSGKSNIAFIGTGPGSVVRAFNAGSGTDLFNFTDCSGISFQHLNLDKVGTGSGANVRLASSAVAMSQLRFLNCFFNNGLFGIVMDGAGRHGNGYWVENSSFTGQASYCVDVTDMLAGQVNRNQTSIAAGGPSGFRFSSGASAGAFLGSLNVEQNILGGAGTQDIAVIRTAVYDASIHKDIRVSRNKLSKGDISVGDCNSIELSWNELFDGGLSGTFSNMPSVQNFRALYNYSNSATADALSLALNVSVLDECEIVGGRLYLAGQAGLNVVLNGASTLRRGRFYGIETLDVSQTAANTFSGIKFQVGVGATLDRCQLWGCTMDSQAAPKQKHGFEVANSGTNTNCRYWGTQVKGYGTAAYSTGAGWTVDTGAKDDGA